MKIGQKIRHLRIKNGLTQEELADRRELSKGFISQLERDLTSPSIATLVDILECLGTNLKEFFSEENNEKICFSSDDYFVTNNEELKNNIHWIVPNSQKNKMEPIIVHLEKGVKTLKEDPHEGEEFGYVFQGSIYLNLGSRKIRVKKGECFYFSPIVDHYIENTSNSIDAQVLWISTPPNF